MEYNIAGSSLAVGRVGSHESKRMSRVMRVRCGGKRWEVASFGGM
mgnify:CR=1 FL=1